MVDPKAAARYYDKPAEELDKDDLFFVDIEKKV